MPISLTTLQAKIDTVIRNPVNAKLVHEFDSYMDGKDEGNSESHRKNNLKAVIYYTNWLYMQDQEKTLFDVSKTDDILPWLKTFKKPLEKDEEEKWKTTYNDYLNRLVVIFRWLHNIRIPGKSPDELRIEDWKTPDFLKIKRLKTKRKSTYAVNEVWMREDVLTILPYEPESRNKAIIATLWDMDGRNHEATKMKNKHVLYLRKFARAQVPSNTKTGGGPVVLRMAFPYLLMWKNEHPFKNDPEAPLFCNIKGGKTLGDPLTPDSVWRITNNLKNNIKALIEAGKIENEKERQKLELLLATKRWNPYCFRHSAIRDDASHLTHYALSQKVRWTPNSKQAARYMAAQLSNDVEKSILVHDGITLEAETKAAPINNTCPKCNTANPLENRLCQECAYPLTQEALDEIVAEEKSLKERLERMEKLVLELTRKRQQEGKGEQVIITET